MKYLMMLVISLGLVGCGSDSKSPQNFVAVDKWVEFNNSIAGNYSVNLMRYQSNKERTLPLHGDIPIEEVTYEGIRGKATDLTDNSFCFPSEDLNRNSTNACHYIADSDSYFIEGLELVHDSIVVETVVMDSVNSISSFLFSLQPLGVDDSPVFIMAMNLKDSAPYGDKSGANTLEGDWTFKTYTFNDKLITLKITTSVTCTTIACTSTTGTGIDLTDLEYKELTETPLQDSQPKTEAEAKANTWSGSQGNKKAEVVMSPDQKQLSIMICEDIAQITSITECSFIAGTRKE